MRADPNRTSLTGRIRALLGVALAVSLLVAAGCGGDESEDESDHAESPLAAWSHEGTDGPARWASLHPEYRLCASGRRQSPIDISGAVRRPFPPVRLDYAPESLTLVNNGHAIEAEVDESESSVAIRQDEFTLEQFHFHMPSEERVGGRSYAASIHLVHLTDEGRAAVVGLLVEPGPENQVIAPLVDEIPAEPGESAEIDGDVNLTDLVPAGGDAFRYQGSLTTPPCTEGVSWTVFEEPVTMSPDQLEAFRDAYPANIRPIQPRNGREIRVGPGAA